MAALTPCKALLPLILAASPVSLNATPSDVIACRIQQKCGASGMCVGTDEPVAFARSQSGEVHLAQGRETVEITLGDSGRFHMVQAKAVHGNGTSIDPMAASFAGFCTIGAQ